MLLSRLARMLVLSAVLFLLILVTHEIILPFERTFRAAPAGACAVFCLPLGYWVIVAYFERWWAALYLAPGVAMGLVLYGNPDHTIGMQLLQLMVMVSAAPLVFALLSWTVGQANQPVMDRYAWRLIVTAGTITAVLNGLGLTLVRHGSLPDAPTILYLVETSASGFVGLITFLFLLAIGFRLQGQMQGER